jgi:hypothetical protein
MAYMTGLMQSDPKKMLHMKMLWEYNLKTPPYGFDWMFFKTRFGTRLSLILFNSACGHLGTRLSTRFCQKEIYQQDGEPSKRIDCRT